MADMTFKANLLPVSDLGKNLGASNQKWKVYGDLYGRIGTTSIGNDSSPIYLNEGTPTEVLHPTSGTWFQGVPFVNSNGVMEIGRYLDFHSINTTTSDLDVRLQAPNEYGLWTQNKEAYMTATYFVPVIPQTAAPITEGWRRVCQIHGFSHYAQFTIYVTGGWNSGAPTSATIEVGIRHTSASMTLTHCTAIGNISKIRLVNISGDNYWVDCYVNGLSSGTMSRQALIITGHVTLDNIQNNSAVFSDSVTAAHEITLSVVNGISLTSNNYSSTLDNRYVTLSTAQTITAKKTFKETIIAYKYGVANNLPFITFDKPGNHATGIGPDGTSNRIHFGPCDLQGTAWVASSTFNSNEWHFQGAITGTSTATISGGIISNHGHNLMVAGNEVNFIPDGYNSTFWFNYDSFNRTNNSTITRYLMGNGSHGYAELQASKVYGAVWNDYAEMRRVDESIEPGRCVREIGNGEMVLSTKRLERGCKIISDTYGFNIGETDKCKTPIAVSGRVLVYLYEGRDYAKSHIGWPVCSGPDGTVSVMSEEEEIKYPSRIIGTISEIPEYETWGTGNVKVNDRIWIYVR